MNKQYILHGHDPVSEPDLIKWGEWLQTADTVVRETTIGGSRISTIFLGLDHRDSIDEGGSPLLFETLVLDGILNQDGQRYSFWDEAVVGHDRIVDRVRAVSS